jgi:hypothetical protein
MRWLRLWPLGVKEDRRVDPLLEILLYLVLRWGRNLASLFCDLLKSQHCPHLNF